MIKNIYNCDLCGVEFDPKKDSNFIEASLEIRDMYLKIGIAKYRSEEETHACSKCLEEHIKKELLPPHYDSDSLTKKSSANRGESMSNYKRGLINRLPYIPGVKRRQGGSLIHDLYKTITILLEEVGIEFVEKPLEPDVLEKVRFL